MNHTRNTPSIYDHPITHHSSLINSLLLLLQQQQQQHKLL
jgi:hypothetical protein